VSPSFLFFVSRVWRREVLSHLWNDADLYLSFFQYDKLVLGSNQTSTSLRFLPQSELAISFRSPFAVRSSHPSPFYLRQLGVHSTRSSYGIFVWSLASWSGLQRLRFVSLLHQTLDHVSPSLSPPAYQPSLPLRFEPDHFLTPPPSFIYISETLDGILASVDLR